MLSKKRKLQLLVAFTTLFSLAGAVGCRGFFVDPTLTSITISPPTPSIQEGSGLQMTATGTFTDNSTKSPLTNVFWTSSAQNVATVSTSGLVTGVTAGTATITATSATVSGSTSVTVTLANLQSITVSPSSDSVSGAGQTVNYTATGHFTSGPDADITTQVTWSASPSTAATISNTDPNQGVLTTLAVQAPTTVTVTATSGTISGNTTLTVNP